MGCRVPSLGRSFQSPLHPPTPERPRWVDQGPVLQTATQTYAGRPDFEDSGVWPPARDSAGCQAFLKGSRNWELVVLQTRS